MNAQLIRDQLQCTFYHPHGVRCLERDELGVIEDGSGGLRAICDEHREFIKEQRRRRRRLWL